MRNSGKCIKCQSADVLRVPDKMKGTYGNSIPVSMFRVAGVTRYVCASCGYSEDWIDSAEDLAKIKLKYATG